MPVLPMYLRGSGEGSGEWGIIIIIRLITFTCVLFFSRCLQVYRDD